VPASALRLFALGILSLTACLPISAAPKKTSVLFILVDDLGWTDLGCYGSDLYETPNIDALAESGLRFANAYAACTVCSPTRAAILTGKYPARLHLTDFIPGGRQANAPLLIPDWNQHLAFEETTLAEVLKQHGYATASVGKWHLTPWDPSTNDSHPSYYPEHHGFDHNRGGHERGLPPSYWWPYGRGATLEAKKNNNLYRTLPMERGGEGEYLTDRLAEETIVLLDGWAKEEKPFFLYLPFYTVHTPIMGKPELVEKYEAKIKERGSGWHSNAAYAAMVESLDDSVGRILDRLDELGIRDETAVILTSDNGGYTGPPTKQTSLTSNLPLRQGKGGVYEGGVRIPAIVSWPGMDRRGGIALDPIISMDWFPTVLDLLDIKDVPEDLDGVSLAEVMRDGHNELDREALYWHYPHYHSAGAEPYSAIRVGHWKLIEFHADGRAELYDLANDVHEDRDLVEQVPEIAALLKKRLGEWRVEVGAQMPTRNEQHDPSKPRGRKARDGKLIPVSPVRWELSEE